MTALGYSTRLKINAIKVVWCGWILAAAALFGPGTALAWDWTFSDTTERMGVFLPLHVGPSTAYGWSATGVVAGPGIETGAFVHYDDNGNITAYRYLDGYRPKLAGLSDGGYFVSFTSLDKCPIRLDQYAHVRYALFEKGPSNCNSTTFSESGDAVWMFTELGGTSLVRLDASGVVQARTAGFGFPYAAYGNGRIAVANPQRTFEPEAISGRAELVGVNSSGALQWIWRSAITDDQTKIDQVLVGSDGNFYLGGSATRQPGNPRAFAASIKPDGSLRWERIYDGVISDPNTYVAAPGGGYYVATTLISSPANGDRVVRHIDRDGNLLFTTVVDAGDSCLSHDFEICGLIMAANGDVVAGTGSIENPYSGRLVRVSPGGAIRQVMDSPTASILSFTALPDDSVVGVAANFVEPVSGTTDYIQFVRFDRDGARIAPPATQLPLGIEVLDSAIRADGNSFAINAATNTAYFSIVAITANGTKLWKREFSEFVPSGAQLSVDGGRVCLWALRAPVHGGPLRSTIECFSTDTGASIWKRTLDAADEPNKLHTRVLTDGKVIGLFTLGSAVHHLLFAGSGDVLHDVTVTDANFGAAVASAFNRDGDVLLVTQTPDTLRLIDRLGAVKYSRPSSFTQPGTLSLTLADDRTGLEIGRSPSNTTSINAAVLAADGSALWTKVISTDNPYAQVAAAITGDRIAIVLYRTQSNGLPYSATEFSMLVRQTGDPVVQQKIEEVEHATARLLLSPQQDTLALLVNRNGDLKLKVYDTASGAQRAQRILSCAERDCLPSSATLDDNGTLRVVVRASDAESAGQLRAFALDHADRADALRVDQPGLKGDWFASYSSGQGFSIDYFSQLRTLFVSWFTYSTRATNDPADQRWYTLQGDVPAGATSVQLPILQTSNGVFDTVAGPTTKTVGTATLTFGDCDNGTLTYQFTPGNNDSASGAITLTRLTPASTPCQLSGASTTTPTVPAPANGFDARQSGSWFEAATSGQGFNITVRPGNYVFASWYTFDPAGIADDSSRQHWFTLVGDLSTAGNASVTMPITQTIGGDFDWRPTANSTQVGSATLTMQGCDRAQLDYRFDAAEVAGPYRNLSGSLQLEKIGGCSP